MFPITEIDQVTDLLAYSAAIPIFLFVYYYGTREVKGKLFRRYSNLWKTTQIGRTLMYQMIAWLVLLVFIIASLMFPDFYGRTIVRLGLYASLMLLFWRLFIILRRVQRKDQSAPEDVGVTLDNDLEITANRRKKK